MHNKFLQQYPQLWNPQVGDIVEIISQYMLLPKGTICRVIAIFNIDFSIKIRNVTIPEQEGASTGSIFVGKKHIIPYVK